MDSVPERADPFSSSQYDDAGEWERTGDRLSNYYRVLNDDPDWKGGGTRIHFQVALRNLFDSLVEADRRGAELSERYWFGGRWPDDIADPDNRSLLKAMSAKRYPAEWREHAAAQCEAYTLAFHITDSLEEFARTWHLPQGKGIADLWWSLGLYAKGYNRTGRSKLPTLQSGISGLVTTPISILDYGAIIESDAGRVVLRSVTAPTVLPPIPLAIHYDPISHSREWLDSYVDQLLADMKRSIQEQADWLDAEAEKRGKRKTTPRHSGEAALLVLKKGGLRLYRRFVCDMTFDQIVGLEFPVWETEDPSTVAKMVKDWAKSLNIYA